MTEGAKHYIVKPITFEKVVEVVDEVMELYNAELKGNSTMEVKSAKNNIENPIEVKNENGVFKINILAQADSELMAKLDTMIQGFLFVSPLKIELNIEKIREISTEIKTKLNLISEKIENAGGEVKFIPSDKF